MVPRGGFFLASLRRFLSSFDDFAFIFQKFSAALASSVSGRYMDDVPCLIEHLTS